MAEDVLRKTASLCPLCLERVNSRLVRRDGRVYIEKDCPAHGHFSTIIWNGRYDILDWYGDVKNIKEGENIHCPTYCGICPDHQNDTCCVLFEVTDRCNLSCTYCFADNGQKDDKSVEELARQMKNFIIPGKTLIQLSGGEPTVRDDLPEITRSASELGCKYIQLNSNGIRLAEDEDYVRRLAENGLSFVFMQFDGTNDAVYMKLRKRPLFHVKERAIENCARYNIGVTLVPTLVPGVNVSEIGKILRYAAGKSPTVRGVHFQPVTYMGHIPALPNDSERMTLDELIWQIEKQSDGLVSAENLLPSACDHPMCGFHGDFAVQEDGTLYPLSRKRDEDAAACCCGVEAAAKNREFVARRWQRTGASESGEACCCCCETKKPDMSDLDYFLNRVKTHGFTVTAMVFQDAGTIDLERLRMCSLHVYDDGKLKPFCSRYITKLG